jgi:hypothetical protein
MLINTTNLDVSEGKLGNASKIVKKLEASSDYFQSYFGQASAAYDLYSSLYPMLQAKDAGRDIDSLSDMVTSNQYRSNVYYSNIEVLKGLVVPQLPALSLTLNPAKKTPENKPNKEFYDVCTNILAVSCKNIVDAMDTNMWSAFKLDYLVTGRGVIWVSLDDESSDNATKDQLKSKIKIESVRWQDFLCDPKPAWQQVEWVARRLLFTKRQFLEAFPKCDKAKLSDGNTLSTIYGGIDVPNVSDDDTLYIEVWEYWDKPTRSQYFVSQQYNGEADSVSESKFLVRKQKFSQSDLDFILPTPCPPLLTYNGANLMPISDVWTYITELKELAAIAVKRSQLISGLHLRGYAAAQNADLINEFSRSTNPAYNPEQVVTASGFLPTKEEPLIYYVDNQPRLQLLEFLQNEHKFLTERIYQLTGISEQMRNVTSNEDDETATSVRLKSKFGSRRLKEHQQKLLDYWTEVLKIVLRRICQTYTIKDLKSMFSYNFVDDVKKEIENIALLKSQVSNQIDQMQSANPDSSGIGLAPEPSQSGGNAAAAGQPAQPMQAQPEQNQSAQPGMPGAQVADATSPPQQPDENAGGQLTPFRMLGQTQEDTGMQEDSQDAANQEGQIAQGQSPQGGQSPQPTHDDLQNQHMSLQEQLDNLYNQITWDRIIKFLRKDAAIIYLVSVHLDDLENKIIQDEKKNSDLEYMNASIGLINQVIANVTNNPRFADIYTSIFSLSLDNFDQTKAQRDSIDEFIKDIKQMADQLINQPPAAPQPTPDDQHKMAQAQECQAKAQLLQAQAQEIMSKLGTPDNTGNQEMSKIQMEHQMDMQLEQAKIAAEREKYQQKMASDRQLLEMKIAADKERYQEKNKSDVLTSTGGQDGNGTYSGA